MTLKVSPVGLQKARWRVKSISKRAGDVSPVWPRVGSYLSQANRKQFASKGVYYGTPWKPLKPEYAQWKVSHGYGRRMLVMSGAMKSSFTSRPMSIERYYTKSAVFGSDNRLAPYHQFGTHRNGKRAIPARPMMKMTPIVAKNIKDMIQSYIMQGHVPAARNYL